MRPTNNPSNHEIRHETVRENREHGFQCEPNCQHADKVECPKHEETAIAEPAETKIQ